jgi:hypothetical protein
VLHGVVGLIEGAEHPIGHRTEMSQWDLKRIANASSGFTLYLILTASVLGLYLAG